MKSIGRFARLIPAALSVLLCIGCGEGAAKEDPQLGHYTVTGFNETEPGYMIVGDAGGIGITVEKNPGAGAVSGAEPRIEFRPGGAAVPASVGSYEVCVVVNSTSAWNSARLVVGRLVIQGIPVSADFAVEGGVAGYDGFFHRVTVTPRAGKSDGAVTYYYNNAIDEINAGKTTAGTYAVTFSVAESSDRAWKAASGLQAGSLVILNETNMNGGNFNISPGTRIISLSGDVADYPGAVLGFGDNITIKGNGRTITVLDSFEVSGGGRLVLENVRLERSGNAAGNWALVRIDGGTVEIKDGAVLRNALPDENTDGSGQVVNGLTGVRTDGSGGALAMSGGEISGSENGIYIAGTDNTVTISGGAVRNNRRGVWMNDSTRGIVNISGGTVGYNTEIGIVYWDPSVDCQLNISGSALITGNNGFGVNVQGRGPRIVMSGGAISNNTNWGIRMWADGLYFEKQRGGIIYGRSSDENRNGGGAIVFAVGRAPDHTVYELLNNTEFGKTYKVVTDQENNGGWVY